MPVFLLEGNTMNYGEEITKLEKELGMDPIYPCNDCPRKEEEFCSNRKCLETLQKLKEERCSL